MEIIIIIFCLMASAFFSATETAYSTINKVKLKSKADSGDKKAYKVLKCLEDYDKLITTILIGNNVVNILNASVATTLFIRLFGETYGASISTIFTTIFVLVFAEITPKSIAKEFAEPIAFACFSIIQVTIFILSPFAWMFKHLKKLVSLILKSEDKVITEGELLVYVEESVSGGAITSEESNMIQSVLKLADMPVIDIMTSKLDIVGIDISTSTDDINKLFLETEYSRLPVYDGDLDHIVGVLNQKDFLGGVLFGNKELKEVIKPAKITFYSKKLKILLDELRDEQTHLALIANEHGSIIGMLTMEDILEEIVGDIWDEADDVLKDIELDGDNLIILGSTNIVKVNEYLGTNLSANGVSTLSGYIISKLDKIPSIGDYIEYENKVFEVLSMNKNRIGSVKVLNK